MPTACWKKIYPSIPACTCIPFHALQYGIAFQSFLFSARTTSMLGVCRSFISSINITYLTEKFDAKCLTANLFNDTKIAVTWLKLKTLEIINRATLQ